MLKGASGPLARQGAEVSLQRLQLHKVGAPSPCPSQAHKCSKPGQNCPLHPWPAWPRKGRSTAQSVGCGGCTEPPKPALAGKCTPSPCLPRTSVGQALGLSQPACLSWAQPSADGCCSIQVSQAARGAKKYWKFWWFVLLNGTICIPKEALWRGMLPRF